MRFYAVVSLVTGRTVETFRTAEEAEGMIVDVRADEPDLSERLRVEPIDLETAPN